MKTRLTRFHSNNQDKVASFSQILAMNTSKLLGSEPTFTRVLAWVLTSVASRGTFIKFDGLLAKKSPVLFRKVVSRSSTTVRRYSGKRFVMIFHRFSCTTDRGKRNSYDGIPSIKRSLPTLNKSEGSLVCTSCINSSTLLQTSPSAQALAGFPPGWVGNSGHHRRFKPVDPQGQIPTEEYRNRAPEIHQRVSWFNLALQTAESTILGSELEICASLGAVGSLRYGSQLSNLWWMPNSVSNCFDTSWSWLDTHL